MPSPVGRGGRPLLNSWAHSGSAGSRLGCSTAHLYGPSGERCGAKLVPRTWRCCGISERARHTAKQCGKPTKSPINDRIAFDVVRLVRPPEELDTGIKGA